MALDGLGWGGCPSWQGPGSSDGRFVAAAGRQAGEQGQDKAQDRSGGMSAAGEGKGASGCRNHGPGLMQEVKEEKSGEAGRQSDRQGRQRVSQSRGDREQLSPKEEAEKQPQPPALPHSTRRRVGRPRGAPCLWARGPKGPGPQSAANQGGLGEVWRQGLGGAAP